MNKRSVPRRKKRISCKLEVGGRLHTGIVTDLSETGLFVQTALKPPSDEDILIHLAGKGEESGMVLRTRLVRIRSAPARLANVVQRGIGVRILSAPGSCRELAASDDEETLIFDDEEALSEEAEPLDPEMATAVKLSEPEPEPEPVTEASTAATTQVFRARVSMPGSPRTRAMSVEALSEQEAAYQLHEELGPEWKVESLERESSDDLQDSPPTDKEG